MHIIRAVRRFLVPAAPLQEFVGDPVYILYRLFGTSQSGGFVKHFLHIAVCQFRDLPFADVRNNPDAAHAINVVVLGCAHNILAFLLVLLVRRFYPLAGRRDSVIQPGIRLCVRFALPVPAGRGAVEAAAQAVLLHVDLPALVFVAPCRGVCPLSHAIRSPFRLCAPARAFCVCEGKPMIYRTGAYGANLSP